MFKKIMFLTTVLFAALSLSACQPGAQAPKAPENQTLPSPTAATVTPTPAPQTSYEFTATKSGQLAIELIEAGAKIETTDYGSAGKFVTSINGVNGDSGHYWAFYLNGKYAQKGASQTTLKKGDIIRFVYEVVTPQK